MPAQSPVLSSRTPGMPFIGRLIVLGLFCLAVAISTVQPTGTESVVLALALMASIAAMSNQLPVPNVVLAASIAAGLGGIAHAVNAVTGLPFGRFEFAAPIGIRLFDVLPAAILALWAAIALTARGVARLSLYRSRNHPQHGYRVVGLSVALMLLVSIPLAHFGAASRQWWTQNPTPLLNIAGWALVSLLMQIAMTPLLLDKFPAPRPPNYLPLWVWATLTGWMAAGLLLAGVYGIALLTCGIAATPVVLAWAKPASGAHPPCRRASPQV